MVALREYDHPVAVLHDPQGIPEGIVILIQVLKTVPEPVYRQHFQLVENPCHKLLSEDVGPGQEDQLPLKGTDDGHGIHKGILMVGSKDCRHREINMFPAVGQHLAVKNVIMPQINVFLQQLIENIILLNVMLCHSATWFN